MALSPEATHVANLLTALTRPDSTAIQNAESELKPLLKDARCIPALMEILVARDTQPEAVRHLAAILLRKRLPGHYSTFPEEYKTKLKTDTISTLSSEPQRTVRLGAVGVAATLTKLQTTASEEANEDGSSTTQPLPWPELFQFISAACQDAHPEARELAFLLLMEMSDVVGIHMQSQFGAMTTLFGNCLVNQSEVPKVKIAALKALGGLLNYLTDDKEGEIFLTLLPNLLQVSADCQRRGDDDAVGTILDVLYNLAYSPSSLIAAQLNNIIRFCLVCVSDGNLDINVRDSAALVIATMAESYSKTFGKDEALLGDVLETLFQLIENSNESAAGALFDSNPAWKEDVEELADDDDDDNATETSIAQGTLDMIACEIPKKYVFNPVITRCLTRLASSQEQHRKAGVACLGVIAEGCSENIREHLNDLMPHILRAASDASAQVRECACFCLGQVSEHCQPEILSYSTQVLPVVFALLDDATVTVQATSCYVLEMFCERLEPEGVRPLLDPIVKKLAGMLETTTKRSVREMAVAALAATAVAAEEEFTPYVSGVATLMSEMMELKEERLFTLRGRALECMGHVAIAVGKDTFRPYFSGTMKCACEGLTIDSTDLHEFAYAAFANLSKVMEEEFSPCLPELVDHLVSVIGQDEGQLEAVEREDKGAFDNLDDSDCEDNEGNYVLQVRTALLEAKKGAITAIGEMSAHCGKDFVPYLERTMTVLQKCVDNWHHLIKSATAEALPTLVIPMVATDHNGEISWTKGDIASPNPMSQHTTTITNAVMQELMKLIVDDDKDTVGKACEGIQSVMELCGPHAFSPIANACLDCALKLLLKNAPCQLHEDGEASEAYDDDDDDHDSFMTAVCDLVGAFARVMGPQHFAQYLPQFLPALCNYAKPSRTPSDRSMAIGCLGELAQELESGIAEHWESIFLPAILQGLADDDDNVKRNAAFCAGVCAQGLGEAIASNHYMTLLQSLSPLFQLDTSQGGDSTFAAIDNAAAAVSRMILTSPSNVPISQVLPALLKVLPLKNDMTENETVYKCIFELLQMNQPDAIANKAEIKRVFMEAISEDSKVEDEIKDKLKLALGSLG
eukprot:CAMPEP_0184862296 /NCGR_PEP_ID=MMETSP0580-20130426/6766_1 /TAXON_ID=1118495 /ORGANISM="Dactyliosolen fragilissimus" /LENGTH=1085 /DNA_ID=CAMNT_0027360083 /DNA_START=537 /DNA_END=3794 /DNA_ORIENTATION=+